MEQALAISRPILDQQGCEIVERYEEGLEGHGDRHQVLQILLNLVSNAQHAMAAAPDNPHRLPLRVGLSPDRPGYARFEVSDTGVGISKEHRYRLFTQGFTTRSDGHGIGLHSASLAAKHLDGSLSGYSDGPGCGGMFTLGLPLIPVVVH